MKMFLFKYCADTWESGLRVISVHRTIEGAEAAMRRHKAIIRQEHEELWEGVDDPPSWDQGRTWTIEETTLLD
jgi:hypothetical protein